MTWTARDQAYWEELMKWEQSLTDYEGNDFQNTYVKWLNSAFSAIPEDVQAPFFQQLDQLLFNLHSLLQGSGFQTEARERILTSARIFHEDIQTIADMKKLRVDQLNYLNRQQASRHRLYSFIQGGLTGTSGFVPVASDFLVMAIINLRAVQQTAMSYGYDVQIPFEMMTSLKVFHASVLPNRLQADGWQNLLLELEEHDQLYFYNGEEQLTDPTWLEEPMKQIMKLMAINAFKNKKMSNLPLMSMAVGSGINYRLTKKVTQYAEKYYQYRYLNEKKTKSD
ncbi:hypothetical protein JOC78_001773 [Bacillus ectoiniformans]|uniref:EcsC family protein n=1 Tax=Bacillus ectoiniformans TaxID=1494429 RepID=UPI00195D6530|nr:EcsC family protein [Bacillus ectoiniformans]MBM7648823.1 hypothetical protein [Bacillus ectoiniformans]